MKDERRLRAQSWKENLIIAAAIALFLSLYGCTGMLIGNALGQGQALTPEQIEQYNKLGQKVYGCFQVVGPPPSGATMWLVLPKEAIIQPHFGDGCRLIQ